MREPTGLGDVDVVGQVGVEPAHDVVVVVGGAVRRGRGDRVGHVVGGDRARRRDGLEVLGALLEVRLDLGPGEHDAEQGVVVDVEAGHVADRHVAGRDRGDAC